MAHSRITFSCPICNEPLGSAESAGLAWDQEQMAAADATTAEHARATGHDEDARSAAQWARRPIPLPLIPVESGWAEFMAEMEHERYQLFLHRRGLTGARDVLLEMTTEEGGWKRDE